MIQRTSVYQVVYLLTFPIAALALLLIADLVLHPLELDFSYQAFWNRWLYGFLFALVNIVIGVLCTRRAPGNIIGPLLIIYGAGLTSQSLRASFDPLLAMLIGFVGASFGWVGFFVLVLLFPNGKPHPRWMRWFLAALFIALGSYLVMYPLGSAHFTFGPDIAPIRMVENPFFVPNFERPYQVLTGIMIGGFTPIILLMLPVSVLLRFRAASARERAQLRWILWGVLVMLLSFIAQRIIEALGMPALGYTLGAVSTILVFTLPAFAIGNAILRHNLYDIDVIIRRTLIYSILTAALAALYFGGVVLAQTVLSPLTASSDLAIVLSTLGIAALFNPLRHRIQRTIDRRFFRRKYNAERTLEAFSLAIRDEVDLDKLQAALVGVVQETMQPTKIALWVREE